MNYKNSKHFCILPWKSLHINQDGRIGSCCRANISQKHSLGHLKKNNLTQIWNESEISDMRLKLLKDQAIKACENCYQMEEIGLQSYRQIANNRFANEVESLTKSTSAVGKMSNKNLTFLELKFSNLCNLSCRTCEPYSSTAWYDEGKNLLNYPTPSQILRPTESSQDFKDMMTEVLPQLEAISMLGGETLLDENHYWLLEKLIELQKTDVELSYNTNFTQLTYKNKNVLTLWQQFKKVHLQLSFDGINEQANLLRHGANWKNCEANYIKLKTFAPHVKTTLYPCVSVMNCFHLTQAVDRWLENKMLTSPMGLMFNILEAPIYFNIKILNKPEREHLKSHYLQWLAKLKTKIDLALYESIEKEFLGVLNYINNEDFLNCRSEFKKTTLLLDKSRKESFATLFPELKSLIQ